MKLKKIASLVLTAAMALSMMAPAALAAAPTVEEENVFFQQVLDKVNSSRYTYLYAALDWDEYWANENVFAAGSTASSDQLDSHGEYDKGAFDAVSRATANHGLHRGSFQQVATIYAVDGSSYTVSHWSDDGKTFYLADGTAYGWNRGTVTKPDGSAVKMDHYEISGTKYVPVRVANSDLADFCSKYAVVKNGEQLVGGYSENKLVSYALTAEVNAQTNGLKYAAKSGDGYTFSEAHNGSGSGVAGEAQKAAEWTYYGNDSTYTNAKAAYGTKFAADNWMHKSMGIQLGLTDSARFQLPEGTDGTGYWAITIRALGYADTVVKVQVTGDNLAKHELADAADRAALQAVVDQAKAVNKAKYTAASYADLQTELDESVELLAKSTLYKASALEQVTHLSQAIDSLKKA